MWHVIQHLPWPSGSELFATAISFICLYPLRIIMQLVIPEKRIARNIIIREHTLKNHSARLKDCVEDHCAKLTPSAGEHLAGAASASEAIGHF